MDLTKCLKTQETLEMPSDMPKSLTWQHSQCTTWPQALEAFFGKDEAKAWTGFRVAGMRILQTARAADILAPLTWPRHSTSFS